MKNIADILKCDFYNYDGGYGESMDVAAYLYNAYDFLLPKGHFPCH